MCVCVSLSLVELMHHYVVRHLNGDISPSPSLSLCVYARAYARACGWL